jgi:predicted RNA-binding Zn-ribbon protein involved in translation (DUF1610 family)
VTDWQLLLDWRIQGNEIEKRMMNEIEKKILEERKMTCSICKAKLERVHNFCPYCGSKIKRVRIENIRKTRNRVRKAFFEELKNECQKAIDFLTLSSTDEPDCIKDIKSYKKKREIKNLKIAPLLFYPKEIIGTEINLELAENLKEKIQDLEEEIKKIGKEVKEDKTKKSRIKTFFKKLIPPR